MRWLALAFALILAAPAAAEWQYQRTVYRYPNGWTVIVDQPVWVGPAPTYVPPGPAPRPTPNLPAAPDPAPYCPPGGT
jgi:hypothetical protein